VSCLLLLSDTKPRPFFLEKLSKHNDIHKRRFHKELDELLKPFVPSNATVAAKVEYLAAANLLSYFGKNRALVETLSDTCLQTINTVGLEVEKRGGGDRKIYY
jgi:hypothetical protein